MASNTGRGRYVQRERRSAAYRIVRAAPVSLGSEVAHAVRAGGLLVTHASFPASALLDRHSHDQAVLAVILDGSFDLHMAGRVTGCAPTTVFTEPAGESHSNRMGPAGARVLVIQPQHGLELPRPCARLFDSTTHFDSMRISALARRLIRELEIADDLAELSLEGVALEIISVASRFAVAERAAPRWLRVIHEQINDRFLEPVRLEELAREVQRHPAHVARLFRTHFGVSIATYIRRLRLEWAADRLAVSKEPLASIAHRAGFADQSHFTRLFRSHSGTTPRAYRLACGQEGGRSG